MAMMRICALVLLVPVCSAARIRVGKPGLDSYSFDQFNKDFGKNYKPGSQEYQHRLALFQTSLARINEMNAKEHRSWTAGIHQYMDWTPAERKVLMGYKPGRNSRLSAPAARMTVLQTNLRAKTQSAASVAMRSNMTFEQDYVWSETPRVRQQGNCGSCWAISAVEAVEAQLIKQGSNVKLSAQALVDCVPNPQHCGGSGGCEGATGELAYAFMRDHGIPLEEELSYTAETGQCPMTQTSDGSWQARGKRIRVSGWDQLPSNKMQPIMQAIVSEGPAVVSVDGNNWFDYSQGVFDGCDKDAILGHAVLLKGYGTDTTVNKDYWLIQNSWGADWGEQGHIRLMRHADEESYCGTDNKPEEGSGCDGGPKEITVCGSCGILYEAVVPQGVRIEGGDESGSQHFDAAAYKPWTPDADNSVNSTKGEDASSKMQSLLDKYSSMSP